MKAREGDTESRPLTLGLDRVDFGFFATKNAAVVLLCIIWFTDSYLNHVIEPLVPLVKKQQNLSTFSVSLVEGGFAFGFLLGAIIAGAIIFRVGEKTAMMGCFFALLGATVCVLCSPSHIVLLIIARLVHGIASAVNNVAANELLATVFLRQDDAPGFTRAMGITSAASALGVVVAPAACLLISHQHFSIRLPYWAGLILVLIFGLGRLLLRAPGEGDFLHRVKPSIWNDVKAILSRRHCVVLVCCQMIIYTIVWGWAATVPLWFSHEYKTDMYTDGLAVSSMFTAACLAAILGGLTMSSIKFVTPRRMLIFGLLAMLPAQFLMIRGSLHHESYETIGLILGGVSFGCAMPAIKTLLAESVEASLYTAAFSVFFLGQGVAMLLASYVCTLVAAHFGFAMLQAILGVVLLLFSPFITLVMDVEVGPDDSEL